MINEDIRRFTFEGQDYTYNVSTLRLYNADGSEVLGAESIHIVDASKVDAPPE